MKPAAPVTRMRMVPAKVSDVLALHQGPSLGNTVRLEVVAGGRGTLRLLLPADEVLVSRAGKRREGQPLSPTGRERAGPAGIGRKRRSFFSRVGGGTECKGYRHRGRLRFHPSDPVAPSHPPYQEEGKWQSRRKTTGFSRRSSAPSAHPPARPYGLSRPWRACRRWP